MVYQSNGATIRANDCVSASLLISGFVYEGVTTTSAFCSMATMLESALISGLILTALL
jgi:hypothetical protein